MTIKRGSEFFLSKTSKFWVLFCCQKRQKFWGFFMGVKAELTKKEKKKKKQVYLLKLYIYLLITKKREKSAKKPHEFGANYWFPPIFSIKSQFSPKPFSSFQVTIPASFFLQSQSSPAAAGAGCGFLTDGEAIGGARWSF